MANTIVEFASYEGRAAFLLAYLQPVAGQSSGSPAASYAVTEIDNGLYRFTVPQALMGLFRLKVMDEAFLTLRQYVRLADDASIYIAHENTDLNPIAVELEKVIKTGDSFVTTSDRDTPKVVTFTRTE